MYEVKLEQFSGPLNKLLELIEEKHLDIARINLASVTAEFLEYLKKIEKEIEPAVLADFLQVAAKLVLIKSKSLLPDLPLNEEEEESINDLEARLQIYRQFAAVSAAGSESASFYLKSAWEKKRISYSRGLFQSMKGMAFFYPALNLTQDGLKKSLSNLMMTLKELIPEAKSVRRVIITLEEKIKDLFSRLKQAVEHSFLGLSEKKSREEIVVTFLAILHLFRERSINLEQKNQFGDIIIKKL